jgi:hypothetical protein
MKDMNRAGSMVIEDRPLLMYTLKSWPTEENKFAMSMTNENWREKLFFLCLSGSLDTLYSVVRENGMYCIYYVINSLLFKCFGFCIAILPTQNC